MKKILVQAFSLVELMITLIIISCIISAMIPLITKKLKSQGVTVGSGGSGGNINMEFEQDCSAFGEDCALCFNNRCSLCSKDCLFDEYVETSTCTCKPCSNIDLNCIECNSKQCKKCNDGYYPTQDGCAFCENGNFCDGEENILCPAGYYCQNGQKISCVAGTYNDIEGAIDDSSCMACNIKTSNCTNCDIATGTCTVCDSGYELSNAQCSASIFTYSYTGSYSETTSTDGKQKILLKSNGVFVPSTTKRVTLFLVGGGGGGGSNGTVGAGGWTNETIFTFVPNKEYEVTIGKGGAGVAGSGATGETTYFDTLSAEGGTGGTGSSHGSGSNGVTFDGICYAGRGSNTNCGGGTSNSSGCNKGTAGSVNTGGGGGGAGGGVCWGANVGGDGGSGAIVILVE